jgi:ribosomal protein S18 acetylase RimI-like enzyme
MSEAAFEAYVAQAAEEYAAEHVRGGRWTDEEAPAAARAEYDRLLPQGTATADHYLRHVVDDESGETVGLIWYWHERARDRLFLYDISIAEAQRRKGYAAQALAQLEEEARKLGAEEIGLHVFGHNTAAWALYAKMGYEETNVMMRKRLGIGD